MISHDSLLMTNDQYNNCFIESHSYHQIAIRWELLIADTTDIDLSSRGCGSLMSSKSCFSALMKTMKRTEATNRKTTERVNDCVPCLPLESHFSQHSSYDEGSNECC